MLKMQYSQDNKGYTTINFGIATELSRYDYEDSQLGHYHSLHRAEKKNWYLFIDRSKRLEKIGLY